MSFKQVLEKALTINFDELVIFPDRGNQVRTFWNTFNEGIEDLVWTKVLDLYPPFKDTSEEFQENFKTIVFVCFADVNPNHPKVGSGREIPSVIEVVRNLRTCYFTGALKCSSPADHLILKEIDQIHSEWMKNKGLTKEVPKRH